MKKILLVDDNKKILELLRSIIPWQESGFCLAGLAADGGEALKLARETNIDILITDLKMPVMDGIELIRRFREIYPSAKILVLSSYNEFHVVREAFKLGSDEYFLKTELNPEVFVQLLNQFAEEIDSDKEERAFGNFSDETIAYGGKHDSYRELYVNRHHIKGSLLNQLVRGYLREDDLLNKDLSSLDIHMTKGFSRVMQISVDNFNSLMKNVWNGDEPFFSFAVLNIMNEVSRGFISADCFYTSSGEFVVMCYAPRPEPITGMELFETVFNQLKQALSTYLKVKISGGLCALPGETSGLKGLYESACSACRSKFIYGQGKLLCGVDLYDKPRVQSIRTTERIDYLRSVLKSMNSELLCHAHEILCLEKWEVDIKEYGEVTRLFEKYLIVIDEFADVNGMTEVCSSHLSRFDDNNYDTWSVEQLNQWLINLLNTIASQFFTYNDIVSKVIRYVREHYDQSISLQSVAEEVGMNRSQLSRLIKKELGVTFPEYLNNIRLDKAKELIAESRYKLYEVAEKCGYSNFEHFSRLFKKVTGSSPKEWELKLQAKQD